MYLEVKKTQFSNLYFCYFKYFFCAAFSTFKEAQKKQQGMTVNIVGVCTCMYLNT